MDDNTASKYVKTVRTRFLKSYNDECTYLLTNEDINKNILSLIDLLNISSSNPIENGYDYDYDHHSITYHSQKNLTKDAINSAAKLFLYLNTCPQTPKLDLDFYKQVFEKELFEPTNLGIILYILNAMRLSSKDERIIASHILEKASTLLNISFVQYQNTFEEDFIISKYLQIRSCYFVEFLAMASFNPSTI